jgi:hypothetical protein
VGDVANHRLPALMDMDMLDGDALIALRSVALDAT